jgi:hypothetical protein
MKLIRAFAIFIRIDMLAGPRVVTLGESYKISHWQHSYLRDTMQLTY